MNNQVTLYIAEHNITGKKYFGMTRRFFNEKDLQQNYHGSGIYWKNHLKKHGNDVKMSIYKICNSSEVEKIALKFSQENNIVESNEWANLAFENGRDGAIHSKKSKEKIGLIHKNRIHLPHSKETKMKIGSIHKGKILSKETRDKISNTKKGKSNHTDETKKKISNSKKGISKPRVKCPHCHKIGGFPQMKQWHFDNCKNKEVK